ncbi:MAG: hypothetical protein QM723_34300 [Myxococcaceae bacterium]
MLIRIACKGRVRTATGIAPVEIRMFLPVSTPGHRFEPQLITDNWPVAYGHWTGFVHGELSWDGSTLEVDWSDDDLTSVDLRPQMPVHVGMTLTFHSNDYGAVSMKVEQLDEIDVGP